jgi:hypothetical protein
MWSAVELLSDVFEVVGAADGQIGALGKYWRSSPLVFSFDPRCQGECGSQK